MSAQPVREDPLAYLPCSRIVAFGKGQAIYGHSRPSEAIYLIIDGKVRLSRIAENGQPVIVDIYLPDEFFGEGAFVGREARNELATALEDVKLMAWPAAEIEQYMIRQPRLGVALIQMMVERDVEFVHRIASFSSDSIAIRLARSLLRFSERMGVRQADGTVRLLPLTHEALGQYVGTSREIVSHHMARLRRDGMVRYSRKGILLQRERLQRWLAGEQVGGAIRGA